MLLSGYTWLSLGMPPGSDPACVLAEYRSFSAVNCVNMKYVRQYWGLVHHSSKWVAVCTWVREPGKRALRSLRTSPEGWLLNNPAPRW